MNKDNRQVMASQDRRMSGANLHSALQERFPMVKVTSQLENNCPQFLNMLTRLCEKFDSTGRSKACCSIRHQVSLENK